MALPKEKLHTIEDIYALPEGQRAELIDSQMYMMAPPNPRHQKLCFSLARKIADHIDSKGGPCEVYPGPFAVFLTTDDTNYVEPDISVICDKNKLTDDGCNGAPDWVIEVVSTSTRSRDYGIKLFKYRNSGVREYWIVNPMTRIVNVFDFEHDKGTSQYTFDEEIPACIYDGLTIHIASLLK